MTAKLPQDGSREARAPETMDLVSTNERFERMSAAQRVECAMEILPGQAILSSSFGAQAAVSLHMVTRVMANIPVVLIDTGYLFPQTYAFVDELTDRLKLNLKIFRSLRSPAWQEVRYGQRWLQGREGIDRYNHDNKVEPMQRALSELAVGTWFSGVRRDQASSRRDTPFIRQADGYYRVAPIADWSDRDVFDYLRQNRLPYHPLWEQGYVSIGDVHTTRALHEAESEEQTRFFGLKRECGLHDVL